MAKCCGNCKYWKVIMGCYPFCGEESQAGTLVPSFTICDKWEENINEQK